MLTGYIIYLLNRRHIFDINHTLLHTLYTFSSQSYPYIPLLHTPTGNILVSFSPRGEPRLIFLDAGIVYQSKDESSYKNLVEICFAFMKHDGYKAGRLMIDQSAKHAEVKVSVGGEGGKSFLDAYS